MHMTHITLLILLNLILVMPAEPARFARAASGRVLCALMHHDVGRRALLLGLISDSGGPP